MNITTLSIDIAKSVFQLHGTNKQGKVALKNRLRRDQLLTYMQNIPSCLVGMEACGGAHYWARKFQGYGHAVKLISPQYVKPYVKTNKNDYNDAEAINEAAGHPSMRFVGIKALWQQDIQTLHHKGGQQTVMIQADVQLDCTFSGTKLGSGKDAKTEIDGGRIQRIKFVFEAETVARREPLATRKQFGKLRLIQRVSLFLVDPCQRRTAHGSRAQMIELACLGGQIADHITQTGAPRQLGKRHRNEL